MTPSMSSESSLPYEPKGVAIYPSNIAVSFTFCLAAIQPPLVVENKHNCSLECAYTIEEQLRFTHVLCSGRHDNQRAISCRSNSYCTEHHKFSICLPVDCYCKSHLASVKTSEEQQKLRRKTSITICAGHFHHPSNKTDYRRNGSWRKSTFIPIEPILFMFIGLSLVMLGSFGTYYVTSSCCSTKPDNSELEVSETNNLDSVSCRMLNAMDSNESPSVLRIEDVDLALIMSDHPPPYEVALQVSTMPKYLERTNRT